MTGPTPSGYNRTMTNVRALQVAIDGPAGAGKSTVARRVAQELGYTYVDTGAMYRALAWAVWERGISLEDVEAVCRLCGGLNLQMRPDADVGTRVFVGGKDVSDVIRTPEISNLTSPLSALPCVRERLAALQKEMGAHGGVVMEGRDIGTVIMPCAEVKVFLTASPAQRACRRQADLAGRGIAADLATLQRDIAERDARDGSRDVAPMAPAPDAVLLDSDQLSVAQVVAKILALHEEALCRHA